jgi:hypothetical protein
MLGPAAVRVLACAASVAVALELAVHSATAQPAEPNRIAIEYGAPKDPAHEQLRDMLKRQAVLEKVQVIFAPVRLRKPLTFRTSSCDGEVNAWFEDSEIVLCYELIETFVESARSRRRPAWLSEADAIRGPLVDVLLHEGAHALFAYLDTPILGREEDAADQISAYLMLSLGRKEVLPISKGIAFTYMNEAGVRNFASLRRKKLKLVDGKLEADVHSTALQRMYSFLCLAYGADANLFRDVVKSGALPDERAEGCVDEFRQVDKAFQRLILPHVDMEAVKRVLATDTLSIGR